MPHTAWDVAAVVECRRRVRRTADLQANGCVEFTGPNDYGVVPPRRRLGGTTSGLDRGDPGELVQQVVPVPDAGEGESRPERDNPVDPPAGDGTHELFEFGR